MVRLDMIKSSAHLAPGNISRAYCDFISAIIRDQAGFSLTSTRNVGFSDNELWLAYALRLR